MLRDGQVFSVSMGMLANGITINVAKGFTVMNEKWVITAPPHAPCQTFG